MATPSAKLERQPFSMLLKLDFEELRDSYTSHVETALLFNKANEHLSNFRVKDSVELYTEILKHESEGHPIVLLNRSMAYLFLGFPHLAATDAYRALLAIDVKADDPARLRILSQILSSAEQQDRFLIIKHKDPLLTSPLMALNLITYGRAIPLVKGPASRTRRLMEMENALDLVNNVRARANYRLCLALLKCGGGALKSALDMVWYGRDQYEFETDDQKQLRCLEDAIMQQIEESFGAKTGIERERVEVILKSQHTRVRHEKYPWDKSKERNDSDLDLAETRRNNLMLDVTAKSDCWRCTDDAQDTADHTIDCRMQSMAATYIKCYVDPPEIKNLPAVDQLQVQSLMLWRLLYLNNWDGEGTFNWFTQGLNDGARSYELYGRTDFTTFNLQPTPIEDIFPVKSRIDSAAPGLDAAGVAAPSSMDLIHWSFQTHVVLPLQALRDRGGMDLALNTVKVDGWTINMLMAKIHYYIQGGIDGDDDDEEGGEAMETSE